jgi:hypothetical protein
LDKDFPRLNQALTVATDTTTDKIGKDAYATEGWGISNRGWMATLTFSTLQRIKIKFLNSSEKPIVSAKRNQTIIVELQAPLNIDDTKIDTAWVEISENDSPLQRVQVEETGINTSVFRVVLKKNKKTNLKAGYGYWGFRKEVSLVIK